MIPLKLQIEVGSRWTSNQFQPSAIGKQSMLTKSIPNINQIWVETELEQN